MMCLFENLYFKGSFEIYCKPSAKEEGEWGDRLIEAIAEDVAKAMGTK